MEQKKLTFKEKKQFLQILERMTKEEMNAYAIRNNINADLILKRMQFACYCIANLNFTQRKELRKELDYMGSTSIKAVEQINQLPVSEIKARLDNEVSEHNKNIKMKRDFNKAWKIKEAEVNKQLIKEGLIKDNGGGWKSTEDFAEVRKRFLEAQAELAREMGMHCTFYDPIVGEIEV